MIYLYCSILSTDYDSYKINNNSNNSTLNLDIDNLTENLSTSTLNTNINDHYKFTLRTLSTAIDDQFELLHLILIIIFIKILH
jgi:hypothetical protein